jgi:hypothetical protein
MASICNLRSFPQEASSNLIHLLKRPLFDLKDSEEKGLIFFTSRHFSPSFITRAMAIVLQLITGVWCGPAPTTGGREQETGKKKHRPLLVVVVVPLRRRSGDQKLRTSAQQGTHETAGRARAQRNSADVTALCLFCRGKLALLFPNPVRTISANYLVILLTVSYRGFCKVD